MHRVSREAEDDLDAIAFYVASAAGLPVAERLISLITEKFYLLSRHPFLGRSREDDLGRGRRSFVVGSYVVVYTVDDGDVSILRVVHGRRDIENLVD